MVRDDPPVTSQKRHARQKDADNGCPTYPLGYIETWGLFEAIDENLASLSTATRI